MAALRARLDAAQAPERVIIDATTGAKLGATAPAVELPSVLHAETVRALAVVQALLAETRMRQRRWCG